MRHMLDLIPFIQKQEVTKIKDEISGQYVSLLFDGTTRLGEVLATITLCYRLRIGLLGLNFYKKV